MADQTLTFGLTGARGFVGSELTRLLRRAGHQVVPMGRDRPAGESRFIPFELGGAPSAEELQGLDVLVHGAYDFRCRTEAEDRARNVEGSKLLLERAAGAGLRRVVFLSSLSAFAGCRSRYGRGKLEVERAAVRLGATALRLGLVYADTDGGLAGSLRKLVRRLPVVPLPGLGSQKLYPLSSEALAAALPAISGAGGRIVSLAEPEPVEFREILRELARREGKKVALMPVPWRAMWLGLKAIEAAGRPLGFRSDSLVSLVNEGPAPEFGEFATMGRVGPGFLGRRAG